VAKSLRHKGSVTLLHCLLPRRYETSPRQRRFGVFNSSEESASASSLHFDCLRQNYGGFGCFFVWRSVAACFSIHLDLQALVLSCGTVFGSVRSRQKPFRFLVVIGGPGRGRFSFCLPDPVDRTLPKPRTGGVHAYCSMLMLSWGTAGRW
jgi:hypothetical protein